MLALPLFSPIFAVLWKFNMAGKMATKQTDGTRVGTGNKKKSKIQHPRIPKMLVKKCSMRVRVSPPFLLV